MLDRSTGLTDAACHLTEHGFATVDRFLSEGDLITLEALFPRLDVRTPGVRGEGFSDEAKQWLSRHRALSDLASQLLRVPARISRLQAFDKSPTANWFVPWHQDRCEDGVDRPIAQLERTVALRLHLDDCGDENGPLEVIAGTHTMKRLCSGAIAEIAAEAEPVVCTAPRGGVVAMMPLTLHRSKRARSPRARRVVHIEYTEQL